MLVTVIVVAYLAGTDLSRVLMPMLIMCLRIFPLVIMRVTVLWAMTLITVITPLLVCMVLGVFGVPGLGRRRGCCDLGMVGISMPLVRTPIALRTAPGRAAIFSRRLNQPRRRSSRISL